MIETGERSLTIPMTKIKGYITKEQADLLINSTDNLRDRLLIHLLSRTGRRITEILMLKPRDIMWEDQSIIWNILKKRQEVMEMLPQDQETLDLLRRYIDNYKIRYNDFVFKSYSKHGRITRQRAWQIVRRYGRICDLNYIGDYPIHPHHFRHGFAIHFVKTMERPDQIFVLKKIMQHKRIDTTMWYLDHFGSSEAKEMIDKMWS